MEEVKAEDLREQLLEKKSINEQAVQFLYLNLENELAKKEKKLQEQFNEDTRALDILVNMYPDIAITPWQPVDFNISIVRLTTHINESGSFESIDGDNFLFRKTVDHTSIFSFSREERRIVDIGRVDVDWRQRLFFGKPIITDFEGKELIEDETSIYVPFDLEAKCYSSNLYRTREGVLNGYPFDDDNNDEVVYVVHFGVTPWKVTKRREGSFSNLIFQNLHSDEIRRYIVRGDVEHFFMVRNEIFAVYLEYYRSHVMQCSNNQPLEIPMEEITSIVTTTNYVAMIGKRRSGNEVKVVIYAE